VGFEILAERIVQAVRQCNLSHHRALSGQLDHPSSKCGRRISCAWAIFVADNQPVVRLPPSRRRFYRGLLIMTGLSLITRTVAAGAVIV